MNGCPTCETQGHRPHVNGASGRCPEALEKARLTQRRYAEANREELRRQVRDYRRSEHGRATIRDYELTPARIRAQRLSKLRRLRAQVIRQLAEISTGEE